LCYDQQFRIEQKKTELQQIVDLKSDLLAIICEFVTRMKAHTTYSEATGHDLGIIATSVSSSMKGSKTVLKEDVLPGCVHLSFVKKNYSGVNIFTRQIGTVQWRILPATIIRLTTMNVRLPTVSPRRENTWLPAWLAIWRLVSQVILLAWCMEDNYLVRLPGPVGVVT
jgi:hypothetical protein